MSRIFANPNVVFAPKQHAERRKAMATNAIRYIPLPMISSPYSRTIDEALIEAEEARWSVSDLCQRGNGVYYQEDKNFRPLPDLNNPAVARQKARSQDLKEEDKKRRPRRPPPSIII